MRTMKELLKVLKEDFRRKDYSILAYNLNGEFRFTYDRNVLIPDRYLICELRKDFTVRTTEELNNLKDLFVKFDDILNVSFGDGKRIDAYYKNGKKAVCVMVR